MNDSEVKIFKSVLRWILFLPSAIICAYIGSLAGKAVYRIPFLGYFLSSDSLFYKIIGFPLSGICCGFGFILFGVLMAPRKKRTVSLFLLILIKVFSLMVIFAILFYNDEKDYWSLLFPIFLTIGSSLTHSMLEAEPMDEWDV